MRNLLEFIWKNQFTLIFFILEVIGFVLLTSTNNFHQSKLYQASVKFSGNIYAINQSYEQYLGLQEENELLRQENARLREELFTRPVTSSVLEKPFETISSTVIMSTYNKGNNFIIIDKGEKDGIATEMGAISSNGIVGRVVHTSHDYSAIMPLLHSQSITTVQLKNQKYFGRCRWNQFDPNVAQLLDIPNHVEVNEGDTIITRGSSGVFPHGEIVGFVISAEKDPSEGFQEIDLKLATNFTNLNTVYLIDNREKPQLDSLINTLDQWDEN